MTKSSLPANTQTGDIQLCINVCKEHLLDLRQKSVQNYLFSSYPSSKPNENATFVFVLATNHDWVSLGSNNLSMEILHYVSIHVHGC